MELSNQHYTCRAMLQSHCVLLMKMATRLIILIVGDEQLRYKVVETWLMF